MDRLSQAFSAQKIISVVRNPVEAIRDLADSRNLFACDNRLALVGDYQKHYGEWWDKWVINQTANMAENHEFMMN